MKHNYLFAFSGVVIFNIFFVILFKLVERIVESPIPPYSASGLLIGLGIFVYAFKVLVDGIKKADKVPFQITVWKFVGLLTLGLFVAFISYI